MLCIFLSPKSHDLLYNVSMKKRNLIILAFTVIAVALLLETGILHYVNERNAYMTSSVLLDRVIDVIDKNESSEEQLIDSLKDDYIVRAKAVSYIIDAKPEVEYDIEELQKIARLISVDEIHLFNQKGVIYSGSIPKYYGYSFDSGEQMAFFKSMLKDKNLTMCQDVTPNTSEAKEMMYAITWNESKTKMIQIGISPKRLLKELKQNEISRVVADMPVYDGVELFVADSSTGVIEGATDSEKTGMTMQETGIKITDLKDVSEDLHISVNGKNERCMIRKHESYIVAVTLEDAFYREENTIAIIIVGVYLTLASCCMIYLLSKFLKEKFENEKLLYTSNTDELTRCYNRRAYEKDMHSLDLNQEWIYLSLDLNGLKHANDTYGHAAGDEIIKGATDCMKEVFQEYGKVYRIGGDEFAVLLNRHIDDFDELLERFETTVSHWNGSLMKSLSISYGVVFSKEQKWQSIEDVCKEADNRMYTQKWSYYQKKGIDRRR